MRASGDIEFGRVVIAGFPEAEMTEDLFDNAHVFDEADDSHFALAFWAEQRLDRIHFLDQPRPASAIRPGRYVRFRQCRYGVVNTGFFSQSRDAVVGMLLRGANSGEFTFLPNINGGT